MGIIFIKDEKLDVVFGYMENYPEICAQGNSIKEVKTKIINYYENRNNKRR